MKIGIYKISIKFIIAKLLILAIGITAIYFYKNYGGVNEIYYWIFLNSLIFGTGYALLFTRNWTNWIYYAVIIGLVVYYIMFKQMTVNSMKFYMTGQAIAASLIIMFAFQIYKLLKIHRII